MTPEEIAAVIAAGVAEGVRQVLAAGQMPPKLMFDCREASEMTGLPASYFEDESAAGHLPSRKVGRYRRYSLEDLELIVEMAEVEPTSGPLLDRWRQKQRHRARAATAA